MTKLSAWEQYERARRRVIYRLQGASVIIDHQVVMLDGKLMDTEYAHTWLAKKIAHELHSMQKENKNANPRRPYRGYKRRILRGRI